MVCDTKRKFNVAVVELEVHEPASDRVLSIKFAFGYCATERCEGREGAAVYLKLVYIASVGLLLLLSRKQTFQLLNC